MRILRFADRPTEFWSLMGPSFASKKIRKEMPYLGDEPGYVWFIASDEQGQGMVHGFVAVNCDRIKGIATIHGLYVAEEDRRRRIGQTLVSSVLEYLRGQSPHPLRAVKVTASTASAELFTSLGFKETSTKGSYTIMSASL